MRRKLLSFVCLFVLLSFTAGCAPGAHLRIGRYELATDLPSDLPTEAPVYPVVEGPVPDEEWARRVAGALGFTGDPTSHSRAAAQPQWTWTGPEPDIGLTVYGSIAYGGCPAAGAKISGAPESAGQAIAMVRKWLAARGLLPADCADDVQAWPGVDGLGWEVRFRRRLDGQPVGSYWTWTGACRCA